MEPLSMPGPGTSSSRSLHCARCGYDVGGVTSAWTELGECPLRGTCSECGHLFDWADVINPGRTSLPGFLEHELRRPAGVGRFRHALRLASHAWRTAWWCVTMRLWSRLTVDHRIVRAGIALWLLLTLGVTHVLASLLGFARWAIAFSPSFGAGRRAVRIFVQPGIVRGRTFQNPVQSSVELQWADNFVSAFTYPVLTTNFSVGLAGTSGMHMLGWPQGVWYAIGAHAMFALLLLTLPTARRQVGVRSAHVWRAFIYGCAWILALSLFRLIRNAVMLVQIAREYLSRPTAPPPPWSLPQTSPGVFSGNGMMFIQSRLGSGVQPVRITDAPELQVAVLLLGWVMAWWFVVIRVGWRVRRSWLVWLVFATPGVLLGVVLARWIERLAG